MGRPKKREREPFWNSRLKCYYFQVGTRQVRLSPDRAEAWVLWGEMKGRMAAGEAKPGRPRGRPVRGRDGREVPGVGGGEPRETDL
jgi:hypothetical protein